MRNLLRLSAILLLPDGIQMSQAGTLAVSQPTGVVQACSASQDPDEACVQALMQGRHPPHHMHPAPQLGLLLLLACGKTNLDSVLLYTLDMVSGMPAPT